MTTCRNQARQCDLRKHARGLSRVCVTQLGRHGFVFELREECGVTLQAVRRAALLPVLCSSAPVTCPQKGSHQGELQAAARRQPGSCSSRQAWSLLSQLRELKLIMRNWQADRYSSGCSAGRRGLCADRFSCTEDSSSTSPDVLFSERTEELVRAPAQPEDAPYG